MYFKGVVFEFQFLRNVTEDRTGETYFDLQIGFVCLSRLSQPVNTDCSQLNLQK